MAERKIVPEPVPYTPAAWEPPDVGAIQALQRGDASADQQKRALDWIIVNACGTYDLEYRSDPRAHSFCSGRRFVGLQIVKMLKLNLTKLGVNSNTGVDPFKNEEGIQI
jgi:hypothetical protein